MDPKLAPTDKRGKPVDKVLCDILTITIVSLSVVFLVCLGKD